MDWGLNYYCIDGTRMNEIMTLVFIMFVAAIIIAFFFIFFRSCKL